MKYWCMTVADKTPGVFLPDEMLANSTHREGTNPVVVRRGFSNAGARPVRFQLVEPDGIRIARAPRETTDLMFWSWLPIFSERAIGLATELGDDPDDFWPCVFEFNPGKNFFLHLPCNSYDVVDMDRSVFGLVVPIDPPIFHEIKSLVLRGETSNLPACFRAPMPGRDHQVLGELFVSDAFKTEWERNGFTGANFRKIMD